MTRRLMASIAALAFVAAACSSTPAATPVADPAESVAQSLDALGQAKTVHLRADVTGSIPMDLGALVGGGGLGASPRPGASTDLGGSYIEATVDIPNKQAQAIVAVPPILGLKLELIQIGDTSYTKINLMGDTWQKSTSTPAPDSSAAPSPSAGLQQTIDDVKKALSAAGVTTEKLADEKCGDADCYHVKITMPPSALSGAAGDTLGGLGLGGTPEPGASPLIGGDLTVEIWARKSDMRPVKLVIGTTTEGSTLAVNMIMDKYDEAVTVTAPPADQVTEGGFQLPSIAP
ncbi:MAG: hypothetical protein WCH74_10040 [Chloroflexota bacterium]